MTTINLLILSFLFVFIYKYFKHLKNINSKNLAESWIISFAIALFWILFASVSLLILMPGLETELIGNKKLVTIIFKNDYSGSARIKVLASRSNGKWIYAANQKPLFKDNKTTVKGGQYKSLLLILDKDAKNLFVYPVMNLEINDKILGIIINKINSKLNVSMSQLTAKANYKPAIDIMYYYSYAFFYLISITILYFQFRLITNKRLKLAAFPFITLAFIFSIYSFVNFLFIK